MAGDFSLSGLESRLELLSESLELLELELELLLELDLELLLEPLELLLASDPLLDEFVLCEESLRETLLEPICGWSFLREIGSFTSGTMWPSLLLGISLMSSFPIATSSEKLSPIAAKVNKELVWFSVCQGKDGD